MDKFEEMIKNLKENKNKSSGVEMRLFDNKNNRVLYHTLTLQELISIIPVLEGKKWNKIGKENK